MSRRLVLVRHGSTDSSEFEIFSGWLDVPLNQHGRADAARVGRLLRDHDLRPDVVHTSVLARAHDTAHALVRATGADMTPVLPGWPLNERHYGAFQGISKQDIRARFGSERYQEVRRSARGLPPPESADEHERLQRFYDRTHPGVRVPWAESLLMVRDRVVPHWRETIAPDLRACRVVLVVAHSNSLRALIMHLEALDEDAIAEVNVPVAMPLVYDCAPDGEIRAPRRYLEPDRAVAAEQAVRQEGQLGQDAGRAIG